MLIFRRKAYQGTTVPDLAFLIRCYTTAHGDYKKQRRIARFPHSVALPPIINKQCGHIVQRT